VRAVEDSLQYGTLHNNSSCDAWSLNEWYSDKVGRDLSLEKK